MLNERRAYCQIGGCHRRAARAVELDLPDAWEATPEYTTLTVLAGLCPEHGHDVAWRVKALLEARGEFADLLRIITAAVGYEHGIQEQVERLNAEVERLELENGGLRQQLRDAGAELRLACALRAAEQRRLVAAAGGGS